MIRYILTLFILLIALPSFGQSISKQVFGVAGESLSNETFSINYTVGETIVGEIENSYKFHQGFWGMLKGELILPGRTSTRKPMSLSVFPNPTSDFIQIQMGLEGPASFQTRLFDSRGRQVLNIKEDIQGQIRTYDIRHLTSGIYFLTISNIHSRYKKSFKIIKQ